MTRQASHRLRTTKTFPDLVDYLRDELDWPIEVDDAEELVFEYDPAELGIDPRYAVKINSIRQIRPLAEGQPWGIFYIDFESKKLPVVVLRRILRALVPGNRSRQAEQPVWNLHDLLFISAFGEEVAQQREIAFAHFHQTNGDLPTLHVLGWDGGDTPLKLEYVAATLQEKLRWPDDPGDQDAWRDTWRQAFRHRLGHVIRTADALAEALAALARRIRAAALLLLAHETEKGALRTLHRAFQTALIHDLSQADFADTYAQTITYGLLTAAISRTEMSDGVYGTAFVADDIVDILPVTNPFLKEMLQTFLQVGGRKGGIDFDELGIQDVVELLRGNETDLPAVLRDFGNKTQGEDPVIHFYEHFLTAYDRKLKVQRGVFYTPKPVVSYIVRSVHELLQTEFGLMDGLADTTTWGQMLQRQPGLRLPTLKVTRPGSTELVDQPIDPHTPFVQILDPATGTATFLVEVVEVIYQTLTAKWQKAGLNAAQRQAAWNDYVPRHLLPRLYGYELMMAPYAIAHMKMGLKLYETGYRFASDERVRIYLTNALERPDDQKKLAGILPALAHEAEAVNLVKQQNRFTVVMGNPPYSGHSANQMPDDWIGLRDAYYYVDGKPLGERNPKWLQDDYVKFMRLGQRQLEQTGMGVLGMITNHGYLDNPTFRGMRENFLQAFNSIYVLDLHGNAKKKETAPDGSKDENVFDIMQGVAIGLFARHLTDEQSFAKTCHQDLYGLRNSKYNKLRITTLGKDYRRVTPASSFYRFVPQNTTILAEYQTGWNITNIMPVNVLGFQTHRDRFAIAFDREILLHRLEEMREAQISDEEFKQKYGLRDNRDWQLRKARTILRESSGWEKDLIVCEYRPFDQRYCYFSEIAMDYPRRELIQNVAFRKNLCLLSSRQQATLGYRHCGVTRYPAESCVISTTSREGNQVFPLYIYPDGHRLFNFAEYPVSEKGRFPNLNSEFVVCLETSFDLRFITEHCGDLVKTFGPEDVLFYTYAFFYSPAYRQRYADFLKIDFPRLPITSNLELFRALVQLGGELVALHLVEFALDDEAGAPAVWPRYPRLAQFSGGNRIIEKFPSAGKAWQDGRVAINASSGFVGVPEDVWNFYIGGYQVCHKWLKDRQGRTLSDADILHYAKIITALHETIRLMAEIDEAIEAHGGWPIQ